MVLISGSLFRWLNIKGRWIILATSPKMFVFFYESRRPNKKTRKSDSSHYFCYLKTEQVSKGNVPIVAVDKFLMLTMHVLVSLGALHDMAHLAC